MAIFGVQESTLLGSLFYTTDVDGSIVGKCYIGRCRGNTFRGKDLVWHLKEVHSITVRNNTSGLLCSYIHYSEEATKTLRVRLK